MATCLPAASKLEFHSPPTHLNPASRDQLPRSVLPILTSFLFRDISEYLEDLVARISAPLLHPLCIGFFMQLRFDTPQLHQFISISAMVLFLLILSKSRFLYKQRRLDMVTHSRWKSGAGRQIGGFHLCLRATEVLPALETLFLRGH